MLKRSGPLAMAATVGFIVILDFFFKQSSIQKLSALFQNWGIIVSAFALGLASINLARVNVLKIQRRQKDWFMSVLLLGTLVAVSALGIWLGPSHKTYMFWFNNVYNTCHSAVAGLLAFYVASSSFRAFRVRNVEATLMLAAAFIVMLGLAPIGEVIHGRLPEVKDWINNVPNMSAQRGIVITAGVGAVASSLRVLMGLDRSGLTGARE